MKIRISAINLLVLSLLFLTSCFKEDDMVIPVKPGDVKTVTIEMLPDYALQTYFSLAMDSVMAVNIRTDWDLALSCDSADFTLWLNTSVFMYAAHTGITDFSQALNPQEYDFIFDESTGRRTGNAIGKWWTADETGVRSKKEVLLIDRGIDGEGISKGFLKIQPLIDPDTKNVSIKIAKPDGSEERTFAFLKDPSRRYVTLSFTTGYSNPQPEPPVNIWDLLFTTYTTMLYTDEGEAYPYLVNGVLLNDTLISAAFDSITPFTDIDRNVAQNAQFSNHRDIIGYDWKKINGDVTSGDITYTARSNWSYIIRDGEGVFYKLRFIDFYNKDGLKGYPTIEYQRL